MVLINILLLLLSTFDINAFIPGIYNLPKSLSFSKIKFLPNLKSMDVVTPSLCTDNFLALVENASFDVREANTNELDDLVHLRIDVFFPDLINEKKFQSSIKDKIIHRKINGSMVLVAIIRRNQNNSNQYFLVKDLPFNFSRDQLIGTVEISPNDFKNTSMEDIGAKKKLYLADLAVIDSARRLGVATKLLQKVESIAITNKFQEIYLHVAKTNEIAQRLYTKNGYQELSKTKYTTSFTETRLSNSQGEFVMYGKQLCL